MKKCIRCGRMVPDDTKVCESCAFDFDEYEKYKHLYVTEEDPIVPEEQQSSLVDNPILCFIFGIISFILMALFLFHPNIVVIYLLGVFVFAFLAYVFSVKLAKVKLIPFRVVGKWLANIAVSVSIFKLVFFLIRSIIK